MSIVASIIKSIQDIYRSKSTFEEKYNERMKVLENEIWKNFKKKYPKAEQQEAFLNELQDIYRSSNYQDKIKKIRQDFLKDYPQQMTARDSAIGGTVVGFIAGIPLTPYLIAKLLQRIQSGFMGALLFWILFIPVMSIVVNLGSKLGFSIGALKAAISDEIEKRKKSVENEQLIESLEYHLSIYEDNKSTKIVLEKPYNSFILAKMEEIKPLIENGKGIKREVLTKSGSHFMDVTIKKSKEDSKIIKIEYRVYRFLEEPIQALNASLIKVFRKYKMVATLVDSKGSITKWKVN